VTWEQWTIAIILFMSAVNGVSTAVKDPKLSSGGTTILIFFALGLVVGEALVLHSGGFW
jgi:hypothetical protein